LTKNEKDKFFKNSIQAYVEYPEELKQKGKKVAMKIISHDWRTYKDLREEDCERFVAKCESEDFVANSQYMQRLRSQNKFDHHLGNTGYVRKQS
jgi:hypothetical protein